MILPLDMIKCCEMTLVCIESTEENLSGEQHLWCFVGGSKVQWEARIITGHPLCLWYSRWTWSSAVKHKLYGIDHSYDTFAGPDQAVKRKTSCGIKSVFSVWVALAYCPVVVTMGGVWGALPRPTHSLPASRAQSESEWVRVPGVAWSWWGGGTGQG